MIKNKLGLVGTGLAALAGIAGCSQDNGKIVYPVYIQNGGDKPVFVSCISYSENLFARQKEIIDDSNFKFTSYAPSYLLSEVSRNGEIIFRSGENGGKVKEIFPYLFPMLTLPLDIAGTAIEEGINKRLNRKLTKTEIDTLKDKHNQYRYLIGKILRQNQTE